MWIKKTEFELKEPIKGYKLFDFIDRFINMISRKPIVFSIFIFIFCFLLNMLGDLFIGVSNGPRGSGIPLSPPISFNEVPQRLYIYFKFSFFAALLFLFLGFLWKKKQKEKTFRYVCDKCNKLTENGNLNYCDCGGEFIHIDKMKWINDD